jgi:hypothetical protein
VDNAPFADVLFVSIDVRKEAFPILTAQTNFWPILKAF